MRALTRAVLGALLCGSVAAAQGKADTVHQAADKVLTAFKAKDQEAMKALAERDDPDPWIVADELCYRGEHDAAEAFARASVRKDTERLPDYLLAVHSRELQAETRKVLAEVEKALAEGRPEDALTLTGESAKGVTGVRLMEARAKALLMLTRTEEGIRAYRQSAEVAFHLGWLACAGRTMHRAGSAANKRSHYREALDLWTRRHEIEELRGDRAAAAGALINLGNANVNLHRYARAMELYKRGLAEARAADQRRWVANALAGMGNVFWMTARYSEALDRHRQALEICEELGYRRGMANSHLSSGVIYEALGDQANALRHKQDALEIYTELGERQGVAACLLNLGYAYAERAEHARALECDERALAIALEIGHRNLAATAVGNAAARHYDLGNLAKALDLNERAIEAMGEVGDRKGLARILGNLGTIYNRLGDYERAVHLHEDALKIKAELGDRYGYAATLMNLGMTHINRGDYESALTKIRESSRIAQAIGDPVGVAYGLRVMGHLQALLGRPEEGVRLQRRALQLAEQRGDRQGVVKALASLGKLHSHREELDAAIPYFERALPLAAEIGDRSSVVGGLTYLASLYLSQDDLDRSLACARRAIDEMAGLARGLGDADSVRVREDLLTVYDVGLLVGRVREDPGEASFFLESGRAGGLLEAIGGRAVLSEYALSEELRREDVEARSAEALAVQRVRTALRKGNRALIRERRAELEAARERVSMAIARIQREAKAVADVLYPKADDLATIRGRLRADEALVTYGRQGHDALALVTTPSRARLVDLGKQTRIEEALEAILHVLHEPGSAPALTKLRELVFDPLGLRRTVRRILVSPSGSLHLAPLVLVAGGREVVYVPSGTTYGVLVEERGERGRRVLALGDPVYEMTPDPRALALMRSGAELAPLPATREEAKAIGNVVLLGERATEATLTSALGEVERWRAVHLACHGLIRTDRPQLSSLALTPDEHSDGFLTVLEVFRMKIPADLVVLSACETARGRIYKAEGVIGFTRAFMMAGAPRVIVSLWKVDDEATRALMVKFYELWNPKDGSKGLPTATALKRAQEYVASHEKWKHPYYWAAWQLWGLPD